MTTQFLTLEVLRKGSTRAAMAQLKVFQEYEEKCAPGHGLGNLTRLYAHVAAPGYRESFMRRYNVKKSEGACCAMRLLGKRCGGGVSRSPMCPDHHPPTADHVELWNHNGKARMLTWHPYHLTYEGIKKLIEYCERLAFEFEISGTSFYFPAVTERVLLWRAGDHPDRWGK